MRWQWKMKVGLRHWEDEDGISAYQFWENFYQNASASAEQRGVPLRENVAFQSILREKEGKKRFQLWERDKVSKAMVECHNPAF